MLKSTVNNLIQPSTVEEENEKLKDKNLTLQRTINLLSGQIKQLKVDYDV